MSPHLQGVMQARAEEPHAGVGAGQFVRGHDNGASLFRGEAHGEMLASPSTGIPKKYPASADPAGGRSTGAVLWHRLLQPG